MLKNNKGYFLTETIIALTIIATIITLIYVNSMSYYVKQNTELTKYNTIQGLYSIKEIKNYFEVDEKQFKDLVQTSNNGYIDVIETKQVQSDNFINSLDVQSIFFSNYNMSSFLNNLKVAPSIKKELNSIDIEDNKCDYRYIVIFEDGSYSTIGVDCNFD